MMKILSDIKSNVYEMKQWQRVLGEDLLNKILESKDASVFAERILEKFTINKSSVEKFLIYKPEKDENVKEIFYPFYNKAQGYLGKRIIDLCNSKQVYSISNKLCNKLSKEFVNNIQQVYFRCILQEMDSLKCEGKLEGKSIVQEYEYFNQYYLSDINFQAYLFDKYPIMTFLIFEKLFAFEVFLEEVLKRLKKDKSEVEKCLCHDENFNRILTVQIGFSDEHQPGKSVVKFELDNGYSIFYKPRSLKGQVEYQKVYNYLLTKCNLNMFDYGILDLGDYGWEAMVPTKTCNTEEEIYRYYKRMGVHICLAYVFSVSDLHYENLVSCGEYPVFIDMEFFPGRKKVDNRLEKENHIQKLFSDSVLSTDILPGQHWGNKTMNISALGNSTKQKTSFRMPVIKEERTSNMHIAYEGVEIESSACIPKLRDKKVRPGEYIFELVYGFAQAYDFILNHKTCFWNDISPIFELKSRHMIRHTQQYAMYQQSSYFPELMENPEARLLMLFRMVRDLTKEEYIKKIAEYEIECTMQGIIPLYHTCGKDLIIDNNIVQADFFAESSAEQVKKNINNMSPKDLQRQNKFIELAMLTNYELNGFFTDEYECYKDEKLKVLSIADRIFAESEENNGDYDWINIHYFEDGWYFGTVGIYLYDGICGIAVFLIALAVTYGTNKYKVLSESLVQRICRYTDGALKDEEKLQSRNTGMFNGESSIVYTYLILYRISKEHRFLEYAKKHCVIISHLIAEDQNFDILDGNAGAVIVLTHMYAITGELNYINMAQDAAEILIENKVQYENGLGWVIPGQKQAMAGMAHGNSGVALSLANLWEVTRQEKYTDVIQKAIKYEDSLYDETIGNWLDLRIFGQGQDVEMADTIAWCHGAPGILTARIGITRALAGKPIGDLKIQQALKKTMGAEKSDQCLCHGMGGVREAIRYYATLYSEERDKKRENKTLKKDTCDYMKLKEDYEPGLMSGMAGVGYEILRENNMVLPNLLALEVWQKV